MSLDFVSLPVGFLAGVLSILSPCVFPLVPMVMASAATAGRRGPWLLAAGLSLSFALAGTVLTYFLLQIGYGLESLRTIAAVVMLLIAAVLLIPGLTERVTLLLSGFTSRINMPQIADSRATGAGQFGLGALLGLIWLPCVGPTLGAAIALASIGQDMVMAFFVMLSFGLGTASALVAAGLLFVKLVSRWRTDIVFSASFGKKLLGALLLILGLMVLTGTDKILEAWALEWLPEWAISI
ncbi:MAG: cytochrome c biogenesis CcdA family protein [Gammaproteobacteria bacterium]